MIFSTMMCSYYASTKIYNLQLDILQHSLDINISTRIKQLMNFVLLEYAIENATVVNPTRTA